jgi:predicted transcriptional regulator
MLQITFKETITKKIEIPMDTLYQIIDNLTDEDRKKLLERLKAKPVKLRPFKKDKIDSILTDFAGTNLYEEEFLKDLEEGLKKSSMY